MPDVGVLNLQIHDDSSKAAEGLGRLADKLESVKRAVSGVHLAPIATGIKKINDELKKVQPSAIYKLKQLADVLEKIGSISGNVGGIRISFGGRSQSAEDIAAQMQAARDAVSGANMEFDQLKATVQESSAQDEALAKSMDAIQESVDKLDFSVFDPSKLPIGSLGREMGESAREISQFGDAVKNSFEHMNDEGMTGALGQVRDFGNTVTAIIPYNENLENSWERIVHRTREATDNVKAEYAQACKEALEYNTALNREMAEKYRATPFDGMTERVENLRRIFAESSDSAKQMVANIMHMHKSVLFPDETVENAQKMRDTLQRDYGSQMVEDLVNASDKADLLKMRIDALKHSLAMKIDNNTVDGNQIALATSRIQALQTEYDKLIGKTGEAEEQTKSLSERFSELMFGAEGLGGAFKRMFPGISGLLSRFKQLVKYRMLRTVIKQISEGFREGLENYYYYSKAIGGGFAPAMDNAATALLQMKNSIGAAAAPLIQSLIPYLQIVVNWFITAINYVNQFVALLRGQSAWSRAMPATTTAFGKQETAAKKAGAAIKDLLADWDELNIIQSETGGGGAGGATSAAEDYLNMFEEVGTFDNKVKKIVDFIRDNFERIKKLAMEIGALLLLWKVSDTFSGLIGKLAQIGAGAIMLDIGIGLAEHGGKSAGLKGYFDKTDILETVGGVFASAIGGSLIGTAVAGPGGGVVGFAVGLTAGIAAALIGWVEGKEEGKERIKWGNLTKTKEEIEKDVKDQFSFDVDALLTVLDASITNERTARAHIDSTISEFTRSFAVAKRTVELGISFNTDEGSKAIGDAYASAQEAIAAVQSLVTTNHDGVDILLKNFKFVDAEGKEINGEILGTLSGGEQVLLDYMSSLGRDMADWFYKGEASEWANGEEEQLLKLMESQKRIFERASEYQEDLEKGRKIKESVSSTVKDGVIDYDTAIKQMEVQQEMLNEVERKTREHAEELRSNYEYLAGLAMAAAEEAGLDTETGHNLQTTAQNMIDKANAIVDGLDKAVEDKLAETRETMAKEWAKTFQAVYGEDFFKKIGSTTAPGATFKTVSVWDMFSDPFGTGYMLSKESVAETGTFEIANILRENLEKSIRLDDPTGTLSHYFDELGGNVYDLLNDNMRQTIADNLLALTENPIDAIDIFKTMFDIKSIRDIEKYFGEFGEKSGETAREAVEEIADGAKEGIQNIDTGNAIDELKERILKSVEDGILDTMEGLEMIIQYGPEMYENALKELGIQLDSEGRVMNLDIVPEVANEKEVDIWDLVGVPVSDNQIDIAANVDVAGFDMEYADEIITIDPVEIPATLDITDTDDLITIDPVEVPVTFDVTDMSDEELQKILNGVNNTGRRMFEPNTGFASLRFGTGSKESPVVVTQDNVQEQNNMAAGVQRGNASLESLLQQLLTVGQQINRKDFSVKIIPSAAMGRNNRQSAEAYSLVTGVDA